MVECRVPSLPGAAKTPTLRLAFCVDLLNKGLSIPFRITDIARNIIILFYVMRRGRDLGRLSGNDVGKPWTRNAVPLGMEDDRHSSGNEQSSQVLVAPL